jgi:3-keto-disaccharide hydrolase
MKNQQITFLFPVMILMICFLFSCKTEQPAADTTTEEWIYLFDGSSMDDWTPKFAGHKLGENYNNRLVFKDSMMSVRYEPTDSFKGNFGHIFYKDKFSHYRLKATYRFVGEQQPGGPAWAIRNNGLMLHCQSPESMGIPQDFPMCLEMQLLGGNGTDERPTANLCTPGTNVMMADTLFTQHCINSTSKTYHGDQWVTAEVLVLGDSLLQHIMEGEVVMQYTHPTADSGAVSGDEGSLPTEGTPVKDGYISVQAETAPIDFKFISLLNLCGCMDKKAKNYKSYFVKGDNSTCQY